jgi:sugar/nucleoside kinase (ribokinase family)
VSRCTIEDDRPTGVTVVLSRGDDRAMLTSLGTIADLRASLIDSDVLAGARHVHVSSYFLLRGLQADLGSVFGLAHDVGATTSMDPNWDPSERWNSGLLELLAQTDVFLPNSAEARNITGIDDIDIAAESLCERGATIAVKFGQGGGMAMDGDQNVHVEAVAVDVVDTTGAGDTFDAGFLAGRLRGWPLERCLRLAVTCGSMSTRASGGTGSQPTFDEAAVVLGRSA